MQLSLFSGTETTIVTGQNIKSSWEWLCSHMNQRPARPNTNICIYDLKEWQYQSKPIPLRADSFTAEKLGTLYLTSQLADLKDIVSMAQGVIPPDIKKKKGPLDADVKNVIEKKTQFRNGFSEHLAFWIELANITTTSAIGAKFAGARPNRQPTDKGPDGLFIEIGSEYRVIVQSVKNSIQNPSGQISSAAFRDSGIKPNRKKQLDAFWLQVSEELGLYKLDDSLSPLCDLLQLSANQTIRMGLLTDCIFNAVVVADDKYASPHLFEAYKHIPRDISKRIGTYVGSSNWETVAETVRAYVQKKLKDSEVW